MLASLADHLRSASLGGAFVGVFLSFVGHFVLELVSDSLLAQIIVSVSGIALMTAVAYYRSWSKDLDKQPATSKSSEKAVSTSVT